MSHVWATQEESLENFNSTLDDEWELWAEGFYECDKCGDGSALRVDEECAFCSRPAEGSDD